MPSAETTRFFIGVNYTNPKAFGIYKEGNEFIVYKNKSDGSRSERYRGSDEAYAVNELYQKIREMASIHAGQTAQQSRDRSVSPYQPTGKVYSTSEMRRRNNAYKHGVNPDDYASKQKSSLILKIVIIIIIMNILSTGLSGAAYVTHVLFDGFSGSSYSSDYDYDSGYHDNSSSHNSYNDDSWDWDWDWDSDWDSGWDSDYDSWDSDYDWDSDW